MATQKHSKSSSPGEYQEFLRKQLEAGYSMVAANALWKQFKEGGGSEEEVAITVKIGLEKTLEEYVIRDLNQIEEGLKIYTHKRKKGRQFDTEAGRLDILAKDKDDNFVVIELKAGKADNAVIGQILGYIGWVRRNLAKKKSVRGIIVAHDFDKKLKFAASEISDLAFKKYAVSFSFKDA